MELHGNAKVVQNFKGAVERATMYLRGSQLDEQSYKEILEVLERLNEEVMSRKTYDKDYWRVR